MALTVVNIAYPLVPIGYDTVGGTEQVIALLDEALVRRGHRSIVIASEGSAVLGTLVPTPPPAGPGAVDASAWDAAYAIHRATLSRVLAEVDVDVVHMHGVDFHTYMPARGTPVLATLHLPPFNYPADIGYPNRPLTFLNCVSHFSRSLYPSDARIAVIPNGVRLDTFRPGRAKEDFVLALGRICPEKGFHFALDAARSAGLPLVIGGKIPPFVEHERYFEDEIRPRLDGERRFLGPLPLAARRDLLSRARCVVVPSLVDESGPLVALEALASGTPVVAYPVGSLPTFIEQGRTGLLVRTVDEMADALRDVARLDPAECRRSACERFSSDAMIDSYLGFYETIAALAREPHRRAGRAPCHLDSPRP